MQVAMLVATLVLDVDFPTLWEAAWAVFLVGTRLVVSWEVVPVLALLEVKGDSSLEMRR